MGGPLNSTLVYLIYVYRNAFTFFRMGIASAMAWVLFLIIMLLTLVQFKTASSWVYYEVESEEI
jgi:multiple sugar transport system permease protein